MSKWKIRIKKEKTPCVWHPTATRELGPLWLLMVSSPRIFLLFHLTGTQEGQEEAAAGWGWILQCVLHVRAEPDPGVQGGKVSMFFISCTQPLIRLVRRMKRVLPGKRGYLGCLCGWRLPVSCDLGGNASKPPRPSKPAWQRQQIHFFRWQQLPPFCVGSVILLEYSEQLPCDPTGMPASSWQLGHICWGRKSGP